MVFTETADFSADVVLRFQRIARNVPDHCAVAGSGACWTYEQLWRAARVLAELIERSGTSPKRPVALCMSKGPELFAAMLAVIGTRRFFVVIDPEYPVARNELVLEDADPSLMILDSGVNLRERESMRILRVPDMDALCARSTDCEAALADGNHDDLACLVYTSGSTGRPKGVMVPRGALSQIARVQAMYIGVEPGSRLSMLSSPAVYGGMRTVWGALSCGASIHPYSIENEGLDGLRTFLRTRRIDVLHCTPSVLRHFGAVLEDTERFDSVRRLILGADRVLAEDIALARRILSPQVHVWTGLGASETGTVSGSLIAPEYPLPTGAMPLGPAVDGRDVLLLDDDGQSVTAGETGELLVEGQDIALGYWRQPERTAAAFTAGSQPNSRRYRTGDLARRLGDGTLLHMGRRDFVVKVRGVRIDLGEIEGVLAEHASIRECAIIADTAADGEVRLAAFVELETHPERAADVLRTYLLAHLPAAMLPRQFFFIDTWPTTLSGKLDRMALLRQIDWTVATHAADPPEGELESLVARVWSEVLGHDVTTRNAHFLEEGGNSLSAMRVASRLSRKTGRKVAVSSLFFRPVLKDFAASVAAADSIERAQPDPVRTPVTETRLSPSQEALWLVEQIEGPSSTYNISLPLRLWGRFSMGSISRALADLQQRHDALRIRIAVRDDVPVQILGQGIDFTSPEALAPLHIGDEASLARNIQALAESPVEITSAPLWRVKLLRRTDEDHVLFLTFHHVICDGWSLQILAQDLSRLYSGQSLESLPEAGSFINHVAALQSRNTPATFSTSREFWRSRLTGLEPLNLPLARGTRLQPAGRGEVARFFLPASLVEDVSKLCRQADCTPFVLHLAAFRILLGRYCGQADFAIGIPAAERQGDEVDLVVGYLVSMLAMRTAVTADTSFAEIVSATRSCVLEALEHQSVSFEQVVKDVAPTRQSGRNPIFQVAMRFQNQPRGKVDFKDIRCSILDTHNGASKLDLTLEYGEQDQSAWIEFEYRADLFDAPTIGALAEGHIQLLEAALEAPDTAIDRLSVQGRGDAQLLAKWNSTHHIFAGPQALPDLIRCQCMRTPRAIAISSPTGSLDYAGLATRIETTAHSLVSEGLQPGDIVATLARHSPDLIVMALAIMRAGGIYLPLDPDWPDQRVQDIAADAGAKRIWRGETLTPPIGTPSLPEVSPESLAYLLYTSGSTGRPKGVEVEHQSLCNQLHWYCAATNLTPADSTLFKTAPTFDASLLEMFAPMVVGARVVIADEGGDLDPLQLVETIRREAVTVLQSVPSSCRALLATGKMAVCTRLRYLVLGGEVLDTDLVRLVHETLPSLRVGNFYGPTETTIVATHHEITDWVADTVPLGRPIANIRCHVLDDAGLPQIIGAWGELCIAGVGVGRGYHRRPDLTTRQFLDDPFAPGHRMYRTGDRVRWLRSGVLEFAGRADDQIKIRGLRIELGEIESALRLLPDVAQAVAYKEGQQLLAAVEPATGTRVDAASLRAGLARTLPSYMLPARIAVIEQLPMLASGKLDRSALRSLIGEVSAEKPSAPPANRLERALLAIWHECLATAAPGVEDDFFAVGGHSLLAFQVVQRIRESLEYPCTLRVFFANPTVRALAMALQADADAHMGGIVLPLQPRGSLPPVYCICGIQLYKNLATALGPDIPVNGVYLPWEEAVLEGSLRASDFTVEEIASRYLDVIRAFQPEGAFALAGVSFGGLLAFEMARLAQSREIPVSLLIVLDMLPVEARKRRRLSLRAPWKQLSLWARSRWTHWRGGTANTGWRHEILEDQRSALYGKIMRTHRSGPYAGRSLIVRSSGRIGADPALGWRSFMSDIHAIQAPGDHLGILEEPGAGIIADEMRRLLTG